MAHDYAKPKSGLPKRGSGIRGTKGGPAVQRKPKAKTAYQWQKGVGNFGKAFAARRRGK